MENFLTSPDLRLTPLDVRLIYYFSTHPNEVISRDQLLENVWRGNSRSTDRVVDVAVSKLRRKLDRQKVRLITVYGDGYRWLPQGLTN